MNKSLAYLCIFILMTISCGAILNFRSTSSGINVTQGAELVLSNRIQDCQGKVAKEEGASISGQEIIFNKGVLIDGDNFMRIAGTYKTGDSNKILLDGSKTFRGNGKLITQAIEVRGGNNRLEGEVFLSNNLVLYDANASLTCAIVRSLAKDIELNGGKLYLEENLSFIDDKKILGNGTVVCNARKMVLGAKEMSWNGSIYFDNGNDIELRATLHLSQTWTFSGQNSTIIGNGNILVLEPHGKIVVERGANLLLKNLIIQNVSNDNVTCLDNAGIINFQDVVMVQNDEYIFKTGAFTVLGYLDLTGSQTFVFQPSVPCTIKSGSVLQLDPHMTLSIDLVTTATDMLRFEDKSSTLLFDSCCLHVTATGWHLKKGTVRINGTVNTIAEYKTDPDNGRRLEGGITLGNLSLSDDCSCEILSGGQWVMKQGWFIYKNIDCNAWKMYNALSTLRIDGDSVLKLYQQICFQEGRLRFADTASFLQEGPNYLNGPIEIYKTS